jgi:hypothetical protein
MRVATIFAYLVGSRRAILEVASDRGALGVGALLVLSAALARNYDRASLIHEPWRLLGPFVASLAISGPLFLTIYGFARWTGMDGPGIARAYLSFLALYWMTAPLAWLYGIPYERFLSSIAATKANLWTLALVSIWRVALMIRVVSIVFDLRIRAALALVMLVADVAALAALSLVPLPVISLMGGISPEQAKIAVAALLVSTLGWVTLPIWIILAGNLVFIWRDQAEWRVPSTPERTAGGREALGFAGLMLFAWAAVLPFTQPEQILARRVERTYRNAGPAAALALMSAHDRADFPPGWQPPPRRFPGDPPTSEVLDTLEALAEQPHADWVCDLYSRRFRDRVRYDEYGWPQELLSQHAVRLAAILTRLPQGPEMARALELYSEGWLEPNRLVHRDDVMDDQRVALVTLLRLARQAKDEPPGDPIVADPRGGRTPNE